MFKGLFDLAAPAALVQGEQQFSVDGRDVDVVTATSVDGSPAWEAKRLPPRDLRGSADHVISDKKKTHIRCLRRRRFATVFPDGECIRTMT